MASKIYGATSLTGGVAGSVDNIDGTSLADKDICKAVVQDVGIFNYVLDADSAAAESAPDIISPDTNAGNKRWILTGVDRIPNGATVPTSNLVAGEMFLHTPTGRNILMVYDGTNWQPIQSIGAMTIYVDKTDGTDSINQGTAADGSAYATVQYAIDSIPGVVGGNVTININNETYSEDITIQGKAYTGNYTITLQGTLTVDTGPNAQESSVQGTGATQGSITDTGAFTGKANKLLYSSNNDEYRLIDSVTADVGTIVGCWSAAPSGNYTIYDWGTTLTGKFSISPMQVGIYVYDVKLTDSGSDRVFEGGKGSESLLNRCHITGTGTSTMVRFYGAQTFDVCYIDSSSITGGITIQALSPQTGRIYSSKIYGGGNSLNGIRVQGGILFFSKANIVDDCDLGTGGLLVETNAMTQCYSAAADGYNRIRNCTLGIKAESGGKVVNTTNHQYSGNTTDETATSASYGYID